VGLSELLLSRAAEVKMDDALLAMRSPDTGWGGTLDAVQSLY
jgi:hypothetical protein